MSEESVVVDRETGTIKNVYKLHTTPVLDGMATAYNKLFIVMSDGTVVCLDKDGQGLEPVQHDQIVKWNRNAKIKTSKKR